MRRAALGLLVICASVAASSGSASGEVVFSSNRCDQGGKLMPTAPPGPNGRPCINGIFRVHDNGTGFTRLTTGTEPADDSGWTGDGWPVWSPTGTTILFSHQKGTQGGSMRLFVMDADGSNLHQLHPGPPYPFDHESQPAWSPTGTRIAYTADITDGTNFFGDSSSAVIVADPDGTHQWRASPHGLSAMSPTFTADGSAVVYYAYKTGAHQVTPTDGYYRTDLGTGDTRRVSWGGLQAVANGISFSRDGRYVAFTLRDNRLYTMRVDGTELVRRSEGAGVSSAWSATGLFFAGAPRGDEGWSRSVIWRLDLLGIDLSEPITSVAGLDYSPSWNPLSGLLPDLPTDVLPPLVLIGPVLHVGDPLDFLVADPSGVRRLGVSVAKRSHGRCRYLRGSKLRGRSRCSKPRYHRVKGLKAWRKMTRSLPAGRYELRFRAVDGEGNRTKHPRRHVVRVR